ncbi:MAG: hypothetical protein HKN45_06590 [Flavobacteriales bacterium]|nr:hypothetical protein [Flavobacteriales bacterium]
MKLRNDQNVCDLLYFKLNIFGSTKKKLEKSSYWKNGLSSSTNELMSAIYSMELVDHDL